MLAAAKSKKAPHRHWFYIATRAGRDLCLLGVGLIGLLSAPPPSVDHLAGAQTLAAIWAFMFVVGSMVCLYGIVRERGGSEILGCVFVAAAFAVWTFSALTQPVVEPATWMVALVFVSGVFGQGYRVWMIFNHRVVR